MSRRSQLLLGAALLLVAFNLRPALASVSPVLDGVDRTLGLSHSVSGLLTTVPLLCFGLMAPAGPPLARRWGGEEVLLGCVLLVAAGVAMRVAPHLAPVLAGTLLVGAGVAVANVVLPSVVKRDFTRPGTMMGLYSMVLTGSAALAAGLTVPIEHLLGGSWRWALAFWALPALAGAAAWAPAVARSRRLGGERGPHLPRVSLWRDRLSWTLTAFLGFQSLLFYAVLAWVPDILRDAGESSGRAGAMLSVAMLLGVPSALAAPVLAARWGERQVAALAGAAWLAGLTGVLLWPATATSLWMVLTGLGQGAGISLALTLIVLRSPDEAHAAALSGMVQGVGYLVAAAGPLLVGVLHDLTGGWTIPLLVLLGCAVGLLATGLSAARPGMVRGRVDADPQWAY